MAEPDSSQPSDAAWPERPRVLTPRGVLLVIGVLVFAVVMAAASVYLRRTRLEKTTDFWGPETIRALQSGSTLRLVIPSNSPLLGDQSTTNGSPDEADAEEADAEEADAAEGDAAEGDAATDSGVVADLGGTPGLGHFRHALLDERHYDWETRQNVDITNVDVAAPEFVTIELAGPPEEIGPQEDIEPTTIRLELSEGWAGPPGGGRSVRLTQRVRTAVRHFLVTLQDIKRRPTP